MVFSQSTMYFYRFFLLLSSSAWEYLILSLNDIRMYARSPVLFDD